jgi:hypothetical protein
MECIGPIRYTYGLTDIDAKGTSMTLSSYSDLLATARAQTEPPRLLFAFAKAELPEQADADARAAFEQGRGGALRPVMCVDKTLAELGTFAELVDESRHTGADWDIVFVSTLAGRHGHAPTTLEAEAPLNMMVTYIHSGQIERFLAFNRDGELLQLN